MDWYALNACRSYPFMAEINEPIVDAKFWCINETQPVDLWLSSKCVTDDEVTYTFKGSNGKSLSFTFAGDAMYQVTWSSTSDLFGFCAIAKK